MGQPHNVAAGPVLAPTEPVRKEQQQQQVSQSLPSSKQLNQNQVHAQTHPWRIKVYNACLACRKKKIKCDGQPICQRCQRLGFECSYIEVPESPAAKITKPKPNKNLLAEETPVSTPSSASTKMPSKRHHHHTTDPISAFNPPSNSVKAAKEIRQQHRSSTKNAASGSFPHSISRRKDSLPAKDQFIDQPMIQQQQQQQPLGPPRIPNKDQQRPPSDMAAAPNLAKPMGSFVLDRDTTMLDLYHILVNSVTIPNVSRCTQAIQCNTSPTTGPGSGAVLMGLDQFNLTLASPVFPTFTVLNSDHTDPDQHHSAFQKDPAITSFLDQSTPLGFVITNKSVIQYLVHVYFECFHHHWMIVDKQKFLGQLKDPASPPDPLLLVAICAAGAKYSDHEGLCAEPGNLSTIGEQFLTHARILLQDRFDMPSMSTLQALLILYWCQVQTGRASLRFMYVGMAIRMAQEIGLNRPLDPKRLKDMDEREVQIRKTIWWSCYQADRWTSAALGKPMVISDVDCVVDYPTSVDPSEKFYVDSFCHMTDLSKILGKIILHLYTSTNAATCSSAVFSHLDQSLSAWIASMPTIGNCSQETSLPTPISLDSANNTPTRRTASPHPHQRRRSTAGSKPGTPDIVQRLTMDSNAPEPSAVGYYALLYHTARIMLYRPFLHNSSLTPALPLTLQSPLSRCRESAVAISEIAETMVTEQRSYRQLFNSIHFSLCAAATVHRFVLVSPKGSLDPSKGTDSMEGRTPTEEGIPTTSTNIPATLSKGPISSKTDLYYLALLLRILKSCCRFSIEKPLLHSIINGYLPQRFLSAEDLAWAREEVHRPLTIVPFSIKLPFQTPSGTRSVVALNLSSGPVPQQSQQQQLQKPWGSTHQSPKQRPDMRGTQLQQHQQYQQRLGQQQLDQQQQQRQQFVQPRKFSESPSIASMLSNADLGPFTPDTTEEMALRQGRSNVRASSVSNASYVTNLPTDSSISEQYQIQQYQRELDLLHEQHRKQQTELSQHHQQQTLQLQQAQFYQQEQQSQEYEQQQQRQQALFAQEQQQQQEQHLQQYAAAQQSPTFARNRTGSGVMGPKSPYSNLPEHAIARNKRQSDGSSSKKHSKQTDRQQFQQTQDHHRHHHHQCHQQQQNQEQQQAQGFSRQDSYMAEATPPDLDPRMALSALTGMVGSDEMMTTNSAPSVISQQTGTTDLSGRSGIASLDELLGLEPAGYYSDLPTEDNTNAYAINAGNLPMTSPSPAEEQSQIRFTGSSSTSDHLWNNSNNNNNNINNNQQNRGGFSIGSNSNSPGSRQGNNGGQSHRSSIGSDNGNMQRAQSYNKQGGHIPSGPVMMPSGPVNATWLGIDQVNTGVGNQLPPLRQGDAPIEYPYPYAFTYTAQPTLSPLPPMGQGQPVPYVGYVARSIPYTQGHGYVYAADGTTPMGVYAPAPIPQQAQGAPAFDGTGLNWQQHPQFAAPQAMLSPQMVAHQGHDVQTYSPRTVHHIYSGQQQLQQQAGQPQASGHVRYYQQQQQQPGAQQAHILPSQQQTGQQQQQGVTQQQNQNQQQQQQGLPMYVVRSPQQELQQQQQHQAEKNQQRKKEQVRRPSVTLLPPLPQNVYRQENQSFSPTSSNTTLVNTTSNSSSSTQQESSRGSSSGRETSTGGDSSEGRTTLESQFENSQSRSAGSSMEGSNESSSNTESSNSTEDVSNSNESGSSSDNNPGSRSSSIEPVVAPTFDAGASSEGGSSSESGSGSGDNGSGNSSGAASKSSRGQKSFSPSGSAESSTSSSDPASSTSPPSKAETQARQQHYQAHQQAQEAGSGDTSSSSGGDSTDSGRSGSMSSSNDGSATGSHQSGGRRRRKNKYRGGNGPSPGGGGHGPNSGNGGSGGSGAGGNNNHSGNAGGGGDGGRGGQAGQGESGGSRHRAGSTGSRSGSNSGSSNDPAPKSASNHHRRNNSGGNSGGGSSSGHGNRNGGKGGSSSGSGGGGSKSRSDRKGKGNNNNNNNNNNNSGSDGNGKGGNATKSTSTVNSNNNSSNYAHASKGQHQLQATASRSIVTPINAHAANGGRTGAPKRGSKQGPRVPLWRSKSMLWAM